MGLFVFLDSGSQLECPASERMMREPKPLMGFRAGRFETAASSNQISKSGTFAIA